MPKGAVTATYAGGNDPWKGLDAFTSHGNGMPLNWHNQGADAGLYDNDEIHAIRILAMEPTTDRNGRRVGPAVSTTTPTERLAHPRRNPAPQIRPDGDRQPLDPDGNPDTSFLAKIPADTPFTFQTLDKNGMVLNMAQTWHQLRPGEVRTNCGGCHAHSQKPTPFDKTAAARPDYRGLGPDRHDAAAGGQGPRRVATRNGTARTRPACDSSEGRRSTSSISATCSRSCNASCVACHTAKDEQEPAGNLVLDADDEQVPLSSEGKFPGTYYRLALDERAKFGHKPVGWDSWGYPNASRYVRMFQSRRSLLVWKIFGERLDGFQNDDHPSEAKPGDRERWSGRARRSTCKRTSHRRDLRLRRRAGCRRRTARAYVGRRQEDQGDR